MLLHEILFKTTFPYVFINNHLSFFTVNLLATLYIDGESTYNIVDNGKMKKVSVGKIIIHII
jgi:hypothetical protein